MSDALEPWKRKCIKKGRLRSKLLSFGPATIDALLTIARLDDPNATEESLVEILLASRHKFFQLPDGRWDTYPDDEIRTIYRRAYHGEPKKRNKLSERGKLKGISCPEAPLDGRMSVDEYGIPSVILMGDELVMTGTPRLLIEFKGQERIGVVLGSAFEEETPVRFFAKQGDRTVFIGTRNILDLVQERSGYLRVIASPAADDVRRAIEPSVEQQLLLENKLTLSDLPVPLDVSVVVPYVSIPELSEDTHRTLSIPSSPRPSDFLAIRTEFLPITKKLESDPSAWSEVLAFLDRKRSLVDAHAWEKLLLMALHTPNARCIDLVGRLDYCLGGEPSPRFTLHVVQAFSQIKDPEGKITALLEEYADIAIRVDGIDRSEALALARAFYRSGKRYDEAARCYTQALDFGEGLPPEDLEQAAYSFLFAHDLGTEAVQGFLAYFHQTLFERPSALPDVPDKKFLDAIGSYQELVERYRPAKLLDLLESIIGYLTAVQADEAALRYYDQYRSSIPKLLDLLDLLSCFETCESTTTLNQACERLWEVYAQRREQLAPALLESVAERFEILEAMLGREAFYAAHVRECLSRSTIHYVQKEKEGEPLLKACKIKVVAVYGGNEVYRSRMRVLLQSMGAIRVISIPPIFEGNLDQRNLKEKISNADLVLYVATYTKHADHYMLQNLKNSPDLSLRVIHVNGGPSRGVQELKSELSTLKS